MDVIDLQVLCYDGLHLYQTPPRGLLLSHCISRRLLLAAEARLHRLQKQRVQALSLRICMETSTAGQLFTQQKPPETWLILK